jgi:Flp pilus assembly protein TadG
VRRGQALLELALCAPILVLLALGTVATVQIADARAGLDAATEAAADVAARSPDAATALTSGQARFASVLADYPVRAASLRLSVGDFDRTSQVTATATGFVDVGWAAVPPLPGRVVLQSRVVLQLELWRSHRSGP